MTTLAKVRHLLNLAKPRREGTPGQIDQERETAVSLGLMADAKAAGAEMTDEQAIFLSSSMEGMRNRISVLLGVPDRSLAQDRELVMIQRELARLEGRTDAPVLVPREEAETGPKRFLGAVAGIQLWHALAIGWAVTFGLLGVQTARVASLQGDVRETRQSLREANNTIDHYQTREAQYDAALQSAREQATETADALERERTRAARAAAAERRRQREIQDVLANSPEPPAWSLRNDEPSPPTTGSN